jgi:predicted NUDIX family NTP pyrophosphohydrolase
VIGLPQLKTKLAEFPEIDRAEFFELSEALKKIKAGQESLIEELAEPLVVF